MDCHLLPCSADRSFHTIAYMFHNGQIKSNLFNFYCIELAKCREKNCWNTCEQKCKSMFTNSCLWPIIKTVVISYRLYFRIVVLGICSPCTTNMLEKEAPSHYQNQWLLTINWTIRKHRHFEFYKLQCVRYYREHYSDVIMATMGSEITSLGLFPQPLIQVQSKENIKFTRRWLLCGEFTGDGWLPCTNGQ